jgi:hypothetical protein
MVMAKSARVIIGSILGAIAAFVVLHGIATMQIRKRVTEGIRKNCPSCELEIGTIRISLLDFSVGLHDVRFGWGIRKRPASMPASGGSWPISRPASLARSRSPRSGSTGRS